MEKFTIETKHIWCNKCRTFTPHFIRLVAMNQDKTASIECSCTIHEAVVLKEKKRIPIGMYETIMLDKFKTAA